MSLNKKFAIEAPKKALALTEVKKSPFFRSHDSGGNSRFRHTATPACSR
jgi:hypothetical protein